MVGMQSGEWIISTGDASTRMGISCIARMSCLLTLLSLPLLQQCYASEGQEFAPVQFMDVLPVSGHRSNSAEGPCLFTSRVPWLQFAGPDLACRSQVLVMGSTGFEISG
jgi:hypothetical protein